MSQFAKIFCESCAVNARKEQKQWIGGPAIEKPVEDAANCPCGSEIHIVGKELRITKRGSCPNTPTVRFEIQAEITVTEEIT
jgi:hypothetical protein